MGSRGTWVTSRPSASWWRRWCHLCYGYVVVGWRRRRPRPPQLRRCTHCPPMQRALQPPPRDQQALQQVGKERKTVLAYSSPQKVSVNIVSESSSITRRYSYPIRPPAVSSGFVHAALFCAVCPKAHHCPATTTANTTRSLTTIVREQGAGTEGAGTEGAVHPRRGNVYDCGGLRLFDTQARRTAFV